MTCQRIFAIVPFNQMKENILMGKCCLAQIFYWFRLIFTFWSKYLQTTSWAPLPYINGRRLCDTWYGNTHLYQHNVEISNKICKLSAYKNNHQLFKKHVFTCCWSVEVCNVTNHFRHLISYIIKQTKNTNKSGKTICLLKLTLQQVLKLIYCHATEKTLTPYKILCIF